MSIELNLDLFFFVCQVESYVAHIRGLLEEREGLTAEYERDNEHLRHELHLIRQQQGDNSIKMWRNVGIISCDL